MEKQRRESVESPCLLYYNDRDRQMEFCSATQPHHAFRDPRSTFSRKVTFNCNYGYILYYEGVQDCFMLFNPKTRHTIGLSRLPSTPDQAINTGIVWLPPENPKSKVLLFDLGRSTMLYCLLHGFLSGGWIEASYKIQAKKIAEEMQDPFPYPSIRRPVICNGRLYAMLCFSKCFKVVEIDIVRRHHLQLKPLVSELHVPSFYPRIFNNYRWWLAESQGELLAINIVCGFQYAKALHVRVFRWDFNSVEQGWRCVKGSEIKDRSFFISDCYHPLSCTTKGQEFEGGRVYYTTGISTRVCSYDVEDGSITPIVSLPSGRFDSSVWVMMPNLREDKKEIMKKKETSTKSFSECKWVNFLDLPYDIMETVAQKVRPVDCVNLRATCKTCCLLAPAVRWRTSSSVHEQPHSLPPWLMFSRGECTVHHFIDIKFGGTFTIEANKLLCGATVRCSKNGWMVMTDTLDNLFFYNPFTKEVIKLPEALENAATYDSFCFTNIPSSPEFIVVGVTSRLVSYFDMRQQRWSFNKLDYEPGLLSDNTPLFFKGAFYILGTKGIFYRLIFENGHLIALDKFDCPCRYFDQNFLLEWDGKLATVFIDKTWTSLQVFTINLGTMVWEPVLSLGKSSFFLSSSSAFSITTNFPELENKIYLSKIYEEDKIIFYCLETEKFGYTTGEEKMNSFWGTKEYVSSCWIQSNCLTDEVCN